MKTTLFEWAAEHHLTIEALSKQTGYSTRHLFRIRDGEYPVTRAFVGRVIFALGEWARSLFLLSVSDESATLAENSDLSSELAHEKVMEE